MHVIATSTLTVFAEACWDCMPLRVAIISYAVITIIVGLVIVYGSGASVPSGVSADNAAAFLVLPAIIGFFWPLYLVSWLQGRNTPAASVASASAAPSASPVLTSPRGFEVIAVPDVKRDCCPECRQPFGGRNPIRWRDTRVCPDCREHLRVLD